MHTSLLPSPLSETSSDGEPRVVWTFPPCERIEEYRPGGFHPVHIGDVFHDGQYKVLRKLGEGSFSTVWLARDQSNSRYVALKIVAAESQATTELEILRHLAQVEPVEKTQCITQLLDQFEHVGPNGTHACLVFEPMGPNLNIMIEELLNSRPRMFGLNVRYPPPMAKVILKQALQALAVLHENGIAQGDVQPGNMLFAPDNIDSSPEDTLRQKEDVETGSISIPAQKGDGKSYDGAPRYLCVAQPLKSFAHIPEGFQIKLSDMGGAFFFSDPPAKPIVPIGLRAPELILTGEVNKTIDIWSFGCLVFELIAGHQLFCVPWMGSDAETDDDHLLKITSHLGPLPEDLYRHWDRASQYFTLERKLYNCELGGVKEGREPLLLEEQSMEEFFDEAKPDLDEEEAGKVKALVRRILQYDPEKRPSAAELLRDPWFSGEEIEGGSSESTTM
ncbi:CMGC/SRPK protein kinase [Apiospora marii]|uniref:non-specific serine/threonine protein kinase n=1 Tax=Apiospora marii TaxID=335849 RepID=A0ABR1SVC2_9PEZI